MAGEQPQSLQQCYASAERQRLQMHNNPSLSQRELQNLIVSTIAQFDKCLHAAARVSLFSPNETIEDVTTPDIQYFLLHFYLGELISRISSEDRQATLQRSRTHYEHFLGLIDSYHLLSLEDAKLYKQYQEDPDSFSVASKVDAAARRSSKIARFREEKVFESKLQDLERSSGTFNNEESSMRNLYLTQIKLCVHRSFQAFETVAQEIEVLKMAPPLKTGLEEVSDTRSRGREDINQSDRLDLFPSGLGKQGPILSRDGKPLMPFTLLDKRRNLREGVFRPGHNLPTMTLDEYLDEEKRRGGIIEGGGPSSALPPLVDEDNERQSDRETVKQRRWDDWKDDNPRGAGNTLNRG